MANLKDTYKIGQPVVFYNTDFDAIERNVPCIVQEIYDDHMIILDIKTDTKLWIEPNFNLENVKIVSHTRRRK